MDNRFHCHASESQSEDSVLCQWSTKLPHKWSWLSQAHHIFKSLDIVSDLDRYVIVRGVRFELEIPPLPNHIKDGYLFVCPPKDFRTGPHTFRWPESPWYWSLGSTGFDRLSAWESIRLGFPPVIINTTIFTSSWDTPVYEGLRQLHAAKGFDPESQDLALHLGEPLYCAVFYREEHQHGSEVEFSVANDVTIESAARALEVPTRGYDIAHGGTHMMLIHEPLVPGSNLSIEDFCATFDLGQDILHRFQAHRFKRTNGFAFVEVADLAKMGFLLGEIAERRAAVAAWGK